jgi:hypothetical protein
MYMYVYVFVFMYILSSKTVCLRTCFQTVLGEIGIYTSVCMYICVCVCVHVGRHS